MITLEYDCFDGGERKHIVEAPFESKEEIEQFLLQSSDEIWISLNSVKVNGKPMAAKISLTEA